MSRMKDFLKNIWGWIINIWKIMMEFISPVLTIAKKVFKKVFGTVVVLSFLVIPFLNNVINHATAHWLWYPALILILISLVMDWFHKLKPVCDSPTVEFARKWGEALIAFAMISIFVINYYDIDKKWLWVIFAYMAIYTPCFFLSLLVFDVKQNGKDVERHKNDFANVVKNIALYWFVDLFYMSVFNYWIIYIENQTFNTTWLSLQFVFGILSLVIITFNLTQVFLNGQKSLWFFMALELVIALITCGYLIFIIPNCNIQEIVLTVVSALIGGILTLVGVAWTIKQTHKDDYNKDVQKNTPYLCKASDPVGSSMKIEIYPNGNYFLGVELISDAIFIFRGALFDNKLYSQKRLIAPKSSFTVVLNVQDFKEIALIGSDIFGNIYRFDLDIHTKQSSKTKIIDSIGLPIDISDEEIPCVEEHENE